MAKQYYDAANEHKPFERSKQATKGHPNKGVKGKHPVSGKETK